MLFDNLAVCFGPLVPEDLRNIWTTHEERFCQRRTGPNSRTCADPHTTRWEKARRINSDNTTTIRLLGPYALSMNRKIAPLACHSDPEAQLPLYATHEKDLFLKRKGDRLFSDDFPEAKKRRMTSKSPRNPIDAYSSAHNENGVDRVEIMKEPTNSMGGDLLIKRRGNVRFQLPKAAIKVAQAKRPLVEFPNQKDIGRTLPVYNSAFAMTRSLLPRVEDPLCFSQLRDDCSWDTSDGNEDSCQSTLVPTPSGSIDYNSPDKTNILARDCDYDYSSTPARLPPTLLLNPATGVLVSDSEKPKPRRRAIESEDSSDINSGSDAYSGSKEEEEEQSWTTAFNSEEEVERQLEVISEYGSYRKAFVYKRRCASVARYPNVMKANDNRAVDVVSRGIQTRIRDHRSPGEFIHSLSRCSEGGTSSHLLKVSIKTLLEIGSGSFEGTLLKPKMGYRGKEISFLRRV